MIAADSNLTAGQFRPALLWLIPVVLITVVAIWVVRSSKAGKLRAYEEETERLVRIAEHDAWRATASRRVFERHQRGCPRCRGDMVAQQQFTPPPTTSDPRHSETGGA